MQTNGDKVSDWLKKQVETKFASDMGYKSVNCWLSPDRPQADVVVECIDVNNEKLMYRFIVVLNSWKIIWVKPKFISITHQQH